MYNTAIFVVVNLCEWESFRQCYHLYVQVNNEGNTLALLCKHSKSLFPPIQSARQPIFEGLWWIQWAENELHHPLALLGHLWSPGVSDSLRKYRGTKVQKNLPNNNHFILLSSLFRHDVWSVKWPALLIIFKMGSLWEKAYNFPPLQSILWQLMQHAWNSSCTAKIETEGNFGFIKLLCLYIWVSDHEIHLQVLSRQKEGC